MGNGISILTHADGDGMCAGAIALRRFPGARVFFTKPVSLYSDLIETSDRKVIICDIAINSSDADRLKSALSQKDVYFFDHHPLPKGTSKADIKKVCSLFVHQEKISASELIFRHYQKDLPREMIWPAIYGAISDYSDETAFIRKNIRSWDKRALYFEVATLVMGIKNEHFSDYDTKRSIIATLSEGKNPTDVDGLVKSAKDAVKREFQLYGFVKRAARSLENVGFVENIPFFGFRGAAALFASNVTGKPVGLCIHDKGNHTDITMRSSTGGVPLNKLAENAAVLAGGTGGGHSDAAGARIPKGAIERFIKKLNNELKRLMKKK